MNILITGATGFIGQNLVKKLIDNKVGVFAIIRPTTDTKNISKKVKVHVFDGNIKNLQTFIEKNKIEGIVHLASLFLASHTPEKIESLIKDNILFSTQILEAATLSKVSWFLNTGTFWQHYKDRDYSPVNLYAATKQAFETMAKYYTETTNINFVTLKLNDTFGPNDTRSKIFTLWKKISETGENLQMSPGKQIIDISYIDNVIDGYIRLIELLNSDKKRKLLNKSFAISSSPRLQLKLLAKVFEKTTGKKLNITWGGRPYRLREVMTPWTKGKKIPGWKQKISLKEGIIRTLNSK